VSEDNEPVVFTRGERGEVGRPNGKTARRNKLNAMTKEQRREHRKAWRAKQKQAQEARKTRVRAKTKVPLHEKRAWTLVFRGAMCRTSVRTERSRACG
jgi:hypothetical protein